MRFKEMRQLPVFVLLLLIGCAANFGVRYDPVIESETSARNEPARIVRAADKSLFADGYCKIGRVDVSYRVDDGNRRSKDAIESRLISEAARRGGDLVRIETENVASDQTEFKNVTCLKYEEVVTQVATPIYKEKCSKDMFGGQICTSYLADTITENKSERTCARWDQIPVVHKVLTTTGSVWRLDSGMCPMLVGLDVLASSQSHPHHIVVNSKNVYWANTGAAQNNFTDGSVMMTPIAGGNVLTLASGQASINGLAVDAKNVYWTNMGTKQNNFTDGSVMTAPIKGGSPVTLASGQAFINDLVVDATNIYWTTQGTVEKMHTDGMVMMVPLGGGPPTQIALGYYYTKGIAVDAENIYWIDKGTGAKHYTDGAVMKRPIRGGKPIVLASGQLEPEGIAVDSTSVYWTNNSDTVMKAPIQGGNPTILASGQRNIQGIAVHGNSVYWVNAGKRGDEGTYGMVMTMPVRGGAPKQLASAQRVPGGIAVDSTSVYWTSGNGGKVMKLTPP
jgi:hypothetical protein